MSRRRKPKKKKLRKPLHLCTVMTEAEFIDLTGREPTDEDIMDLREDNILIEGIEYVC